MSRRHAPWPTLLALLIVCTAALTSAAVFPPARPTAGEEPAQFLRLGDGSAAFTLLVAANADLYNLPREATRAIILVQDARQPIPASDLADRHNALVLAPKFLDSRDPRVQPDLPAWRDDGWRHGLPASSGPGRLSALHILDALIDYLKHHPQLPALTEITLIGQDAGIELLALHQRHHTRDGHSLRTDHSTSAGEVSAQR